LATRGTTTTPARDDDEEDDEEEEEDDDDVDDDDALGVVTACVARIRRVSDASLDAVTRD